MDNPISFIHLGGGLNNRAGVLKVGENESSDLANVDFNKFGSIVKRRGYYWLNPTTIPDTSALPYVAGDDNPPPFSGDFGIPLFELGYGIYFSTWIEQQDFIPDIRISHSESKA